MLNGEVKNMPWENIWDCLNRPILCFYERDVKFIMIHYIKPMRERLFRLNQCRSDQCDKGDGVENVVHLCAHTSHTSPELDPCLKYCSPNGT